MLFENLQIIVGFKDLYTAMNLVLQPLSFYSDVQKCFDFASPGSELLLSLSLTIPPGLLQFSSLIVNLLQLILVGKVFS